MTAVRDGEGNSELTLSNCQEHSDVHTHKHTPPVSPNDAAHTGSQVGKSLEHQTILLCIPSPLSTPLLPAFLSFFFLTHTLLLLLFSFLLFTSALIPEYYVIVSPPKQTGVLLSHHTPLYVLRCQMGSHLATSKDTEPTHPQ